MSILVNVLNLTRLPDIVNPAGENVNVIVMDLSFTDVVDVKEASMRPTLFAEILEDLNAQLATIFEQRIMSPHPDPFGALFLNDTDDDDDHGGVNDEDDIEDTEVQENLDDGRIPVIVRPNDRIGVELRIPGSRRDRFFKMVKFRNNPLQALFDMISSILQSDETLIFAVWHFTIHVVHTPIGLGGSRKRKRFYGAWCDDDATRLKSVVEVRGDGLCMWRALVVAHAWYEYTLVSPAPAAEKARRMREYKKIARQSGRLQKELARQLKLDTNTAHGTYDDMVAIANHWSCHITVVDRGIKGLVKFRTAEMYKGPDLECTLYLLKRADREHYDCLKSMKALLGASYYCDRCNQASRNKYEHRCPGSQRCRLCHREREAHRNGPDPPLECKSCDRTFWDKECYLGHRDGICKKSWRQVFFH